MGDLVEIQLRLGLARLLLQVVRFAEAFVYLREPFLLLLVVLIVPLVYLIVELVYVIHSYWLQEHLVEAVCMALILNAFVNVRGAGNYQWLVVRVRVRLRDVTHHEVVQRQLVNVLLLLLLFESFVDGDYLFACLVSIHNWHVQVENDGIEMLRLNKRFTRLVLVKLSYVLLNRFDGLVTIDCLNYLSVLSHLEEVTHRKKLKGVIIDDQDLVIV